MIPSILASFVTSVAGRALDQKAIDQQNFYNSPAQQVKRLNEAGLNPNLIYGSIQPSTQTNVPSSNLDPSVIATSVLKSKELAMAEDLNRKQIEEIDSKIRNNDADTANKQAQNPVYQETARQLKEANDMQELFNRYKREHPESTYIPELENFHNQLEHIKKMDDIAEQKLALDKLLNSATTKKLEAETSLIKKNEAKVDEEIEILKLDVKNYVQRYLEAPTPWLAGAIITALARFSHISGESPTEIINNAIDAISEDSKKSKDDINKKLTNVYRSKYVKHDSTYTYRVITSGPMKGKYVKIRQSDGHSEIIDSL